MSRHKHLTHLLSLVHDKYLAWLLALGVSLAVVSALDVVGPATIILRTTALILAVTFAMRYVRLPWRSTEEGKHLMGLTIVTAAFMAWATVNGVAAYLDPTVPSLDGAYPGRAHIGYVLFFAITGELVNRNHLLTVAVRESREER